MRFRPSAFRPLRWIAVPGLALLILVWFAAACAEEQPAPPPQQPASSAAAPTAVPIDTSPQMSREAPLPAPTASLPPPTVAPTVAPNTPTPVPRPTRSPSALEATPSPTLEAPTAVPTSPPQDQSGTQPGVDSVAIVWGDLFGQLSTTEQECLRTELGEDQLHDIGEQAISPEEPQWAPAVFGCLSPDTALALPGAMMFSLMVNEVLLGPAGQAEIPPEARECIHELIADTDVGAVISAALQDPMSGQMPNEAVMAFAMGIETCVPASSGTPPTGMMGPPPSQHIELPEEATLWQFSIPGWAMSAPTVSDGTVYVGADDNNVYALDSTNGAPLWTFETGDVVRAPAIVLDGIVYIGSNDNNLYALDDETGDLLWQHDAGSPVQYAPLVGDGAIYVPTISEGGRKIHALDAESGVELWVASQYFPFDTGWESGIGAALADDTLLAIGDEGELHALDSQTGETVWSFRGDVRTDTPPVPIGDVVYITASNTAYALDLETGAELWKFSTGMFPARGFAPVIEGGMYFFSPDDHAYGLDIASGEQAWIFGLDSMANTVPVVSEGMVYVASEYGALYALDQQTGDEVWILGPSDNMLQSLEVADGVLYLESSDGYLVALDAMTGQELWGFNKGFFSGVRTYTLSDGIVYVSSLNGAIYAIDASVAAGR